VLVYLYQHGIFFAGDIAFHCSAPASQSAHIGKLIEGIDRINRMDVDLIVARSCPRPGKSNLPSRRAQGKARGVRHCRFEDEGRQL
jgi:hypothetical protein